MKQKKYFKDFIASLQLNDSIKHETLIILSNCMAFCGVMLSFSYWKETYKVVFTEYSYLYRYFKAKSFNN